MATDVSLDLTDLPQPKHFRPQKSPLRLSRKRPWKRVVLPLALIAFVASSAFLFAATMSSDEIGPQLTHIITRGDLDVTVIEQGLLESSENTEIKCQVRGRNTVLWVIDSGTTVQPGDELVRLDSLFIEEQIDERTKYANWSRSGAERSEANVARAKLAVPEYEQGRFISELARLEKDLVIAEAKLRTSKDKLSHTKMLAKSDYKSQLEVELDRFAVSQAELDVKLAGTRLNVLREFTKEEVLTTLKGALKSAQANHQANAERAIADASRRDRALEEIQHCVIKADRSGLVIHRNAAQWEVAPIAEGAAVHKDQILLLMPDLTKMQVKVGIHESLVDRMQEGLSVRVTLPDQTLDGTVSSISSITRPAGWWTGNEVRYDTFVKLPPVDGLKPGMSAELEIIIASYRDVLKIPVAAVVESETGDFCFVKSDDGPQRRKLRIGDSNGIFTIVEQGLREGDEVLLNPHAFTGLSANSTKQTNEPDRSQTESADK